MANLDWERTCWRDEYRLVAGIDEAGRGALAGPIVAAAVVLPHGLRLTKGLREITDSKLLPEVKRDRLANLVRSVAVDWAIGHASAAEIDELGISCTNRLCMERALAGLSCGADFLLLDAFNCDSPLPQVGLIDGDGISLSIAAASILAKTERDRFMRELHQHDDRYCFDRHVGYGTPVHLEALRIHGPCAMHRLTFRGVLPEATE